MLELGIYVACFLFFISKRTPLINFEKKFAPTIKRKFGLLHRRETELPKKQLQNYSKKLSKQRDRGTNIPKITTKGKRTKVFNDLRTNN